MNAYAEAMASAGAALLSKQWSSRSLRDVYADFNDLTLAIVADALFGADVRGEDARAINGAIRDAFAYFAKRSSVGFVVPEWVPTPDNLAYNGAVAKLDEAVYALIARRRAKRTGADGDVRVAAAKEGEANPRRVPRVAWDAAAKDWVPTDSSPSARFSEENDATDATSVRAPDLLDRLLDAVDEEGDGAGMDDVSLRDELMTLMVAGRETSAILLSGVRVSRPAPGGGGAMRRRGGGGHRARPPERFADSRVLRAVEVLRSGRVRGDAAGAARVHGGPVLRGGRARGRVRPPEGHDGSGGALPTAPRRALLVEAARVRPRPVAKRGALRVPPEGHGPERRVRPLRRGSARVHRHGRHDGGDALLATVARGVGCASSRAAPRPRALITLRPEPFELDVVPRRRR